MCKAISAEKVGCFDSVKYLGKKATGKKVLAVSVVPLSPRTLALAKLHMSLESVKNGLKLSSVVSWNCRMPSPK